MALTFDSSGNSRTSSTSLTYPVTTTGTNLVLVAQVMQNSGSDSVTGVTYNGVSMTRLYGAIPSGLMWTYVYVLYAPTTGTHDIVVSANTNSFIGSVAMSYSGAAQSGNFLGITNNGSTGITSTNVTVAMTYTNSYMVGFGEVASGANPTAGSGTVRRVINASDGNSGFDSNGIATGNYTLNMSWAGSAAAYMQGFEIVDVAPTSRAATGNFLAFF